MMVGSWYMPAKRAATLARIRGLRLGGESWQETFAKGVPSDTAQNRTIGQFGNRGKAVVGKGKLRSSEGKIIRHAPFE